jgi:hypothetical protein
LGGVIWLNVVFIAVDGNDFEYGLVLKIALDENVISCGVGGDREIR